MVASSSGFGAVESCDEGGKSKNPIFESAFESCDESGKSKNSLFEKFKLRVFEIAQQGEKK
jgi:hypothetical protein